MTEEEWLTGSKPRPYLDHPACESARKRRLLACAVCRQLLPVMRHRVFASAVEVSELYADGLTDARALEGAHRAMGRVPRKQWYDPRLEPWQDILLLRFDDLLQVEDFSIRLIIESGCNNLEGLKRMPGEFDLPRIGGGIVCDLLRDVFGNPFRPAAFSPSWRTDTAVSLARTMYESREFSAMPILADALQDAGCTNDDILAHCRAEQAHVRGCWVIDLVLGKS